MARITLQVIEGLERGRTFSDLSTPVTIGREDDNAVRLNDERVSRFHAKIQEDGGRVILTDLESTNGTRVNGHPVQMRVLQAGDQLSIGRCLLIFGSREQIAELSRRNDSRLDERTQLPEQTLSSFDGLPALPSPSAGHVAADGDALFPNGPPEPPESLQAFQRAELSDFLAYAHEQIRTVAQSAFSDPQQREGEMGLMHVPWPAWQRLLQLEMDLAVYLKRIADPER